MQKKFGIVVVAAIQEASQKQVKVARPGIQKTSRRRLKHRVAAAATIAA